MSNVLSYLGLSLFLIWFIQSQKIFDLVFFTKWLKELRACGLCLGTWICFGTYFLFGIGILDGLPQTILVQIANPIITAAISSFIIFLFRLGWQSKYGVYIAK